MLLLDISIKGFVCCGISNDTNIKLNNKSNDVLKIKSDNKNDEDDENGEDVDAGEDDENGDVDITEIDSDKSDEY